MAQPVDSTEIVFPLSDCAIKKDNFLMLSPTSIYKIFIIKTIAIDLLKICRKMYNKFKIKI